MKKIIITLIINILLYSNMYAQHDLSCNDCVGTKDTVVTFYQSNSDNTVYTGMFKLINADAQISYLSFPVIGRINTIEDLKDGEGRNGYILEGNINLIYPLWHGRNQTDKFYQNKRFSFKYNPGLRMTRDNSSPIYPTNQKVGFQFENVLWQNYTKKSNIVRTRAGNFDNRNWKCDKTNNFHMLYLTINAMHYSNGQQGSSIDTNILIYKNNYKTGDFSTNYLQVTLTYNLLFKNHRIFSSALSYQRDGNFIGPFSFDEDQENRYGKNRLSGFIQYRTAPQKHRGSKKGNDLRCNLNVDLKVKRLHTFRFRYEFEYILDNTNLRKAEGSQYKWSNHFYLEYDPLRSRTTSFIFHAYYGRDYFNIRYDDIICAEMVGLAFDFYKYFPPKYVTNDLIEK
jgi:hypothetical protein